jgi:phage baseplate assembly protein W
MAKVYGYNPPFFGGPQNVMSRQEDARLIKNDLLQLLMTVPGERVYKPNFGVNLRNVVFEQLDEETITRLESEISKKIGQYEQRVVVETVQVTKNDTAQYLNVKVVCSLKDDPNSYLDIALNVGEKNG